MICAPAAAGQVREPEQGHPHPGGARGGLGARATQLLAGEGARGGGGESPPTPRTRCLSARASSGSQPTASRASSAPWPRRRRRGRRRSAASCRRVAPSQAGAATARLLFALGENTEKRTQAHASMRKRKHTHMCTQRTHPRTTARRKRTPPHAAAPHPRTARNAQSLERKFVAGRGLWSAAVEAAAVVDALMALAGAHKRPRAARLRHGRALRGAARRCAPLPRRPRAPGPGAQVDTSRSPALLPPGPRPAVARPRGQT